ncbi:ABC transporter ATP-binding protein [Evansella sp. AB-P1]|uniref:ABC transporter ATP-binding protein n=1 Tax=Evansella sp. AB-P1 TaxID=3037653 RepID=UPI00241EB6CB|nr:ABC transporter ATP-binding protein [Evansella sp. AB-P1]MDG5787211.1 ABC transporter ATP-binding protein [Evansella sp. AB-P1]
MEDKMNIDVTTTNNQLTSDIVLQVKDLKTHFDLEEGLLKAVEGVSFSLRQGKTLGIVGESGSGKSLSAQTIMRIVPPHAKLGGEVLLKRRRKGKDDKIVNVIGLPLNSPEMRDIRGGEIAMIFQEPMKAFSPIYTIGNQVSEAILLHSNVNKEEAKKIAIESLRKVGMSNPEQRFDEYPHQLSGGMRQRAMIAMALSCKPSILIADEPTTALDVTVQAQVLQLINELKDSLNTSVIFITHDLGVIAEIADEVAVMYLGEVVEYTDVDTLFHNPLHPYTKALLKSIPSTANRHEKLESIKGTVPTPINLPEGCRFYTRCKYAVDGVCNDNDIQLTSVNEKHDVRCVRWDEIEEEG